MTIFKIKNMRTGIILSFNKLASVGVLKDVNGQTIKFYANEAELILARGENVSFDIAFRNRGLVAVNLKVFDRES